MRRTLSDAERALWRKVARTVRPYLPLPEPASAPPAPAEKPAPAAKDAPAPAHKSVRSPPSAPADRGGERRVRRGDLELDAVLDLHGHTQDRAQRALARFLIQAQADGARVVLVITGKGRGGAEGVLKARLLDWLGAPGIRPLIAGFAEAHARHGGAGAAYVFLKRSA